MNGVRGDEMRIVDRKTLANMPDGTLFCRYEPDMLCGEWNVITGHNEKYNGVKNTVGFRSVLPLEPFLDKTYDSDVGSIRITNWCTIDTCDYDYNENDLFAVFSKTEIRAMITVLQYALADCNFSITKFMDTYYYNDQEIDENELDKWLD